MIRRIIGWLERIFGGFTSQEHKLGIELVPFTMHGCNVRSRISADQWKKVCSVVHKKARNDHRCQICNRSGKSQGFTWPVECHEVWDFNEATGTQKLTGMQSICPMCHKVKHLGLATRQGYGEAALVHLAKVNGIDAACAEKLVAHAKTVVKQRSSQEWKLDLTYLNKNEFGFLMTKFTDDEAHKCKNIEF